MPLQRPIGFRPWEISSMINEQVVAQHAEEAAFLWMLRDRAVRAPHYDLKDLAALDERVEAHLDGLRVAGTYGWKLCEGALASGPGEMFAAAVLACGSERADLIEKVLAVSSPELERPLVSALGWLPFSQVSALCHELSQSECPEHRRIAISSFGAHRQLPGSALVRALVDDNARLRARGLETTGQLGGRDLVAALVQSFTDADADCRFYAAWSAARKGVRSEEVFSELRNCTEGMEAYAEGALAMALACMDISEAKKWLCMLRSPPLSLRLFIAGAGLLGDPELVPDVMEYMKIPDLARVAGEAFSMITGLDLAYQDFDQDAPEGFQSGPSEEPENEDVTPDPDEDLPWPAPELVGQWWAKHRGDFSAGRRFLGGKEISRPSLLEVLKFGKQRQRRVAALNLGVLEPDQPLFAVRSPGKRQMQELGLWIL